MANRLQLKRGTTVPGSIFYEGEPIYDKSGKVLYIGDNAGIGSGTGSAVASAEAYSAVAELLTAASASAGGSVKFYEDTDNGNNYVQLSAPASVGTNVTFVLPETDGSEGHILKTDGAGNLSFAAPAASTINIFDGSNTDTVSTGQTITFSGGTGITPTVSDNQISYDLDSELVAISTVTSAADKVPYFTGSGTADVTTLTSFGRSLIDDVDAETARTTLGVDAAGTDNSTDVTLSGSYDYLTIAGQVITLGQIDLTTDVTGALPNSNLANSTISVSDGSSSSSVSLGSTITFSGTANEVTVSQSSGTITVGLPDDVSVAGDLTVSGNLRVVGTAVTFEAQTLKIEDRIIELGLVDGSEPSSTTTWDTGIAFNYFQTSAKKSGVIWLDNQFMALLSEISESSDTGTADPQITATAFAPVAAGGLYIGGIAAGNQVINSSQEAVNLVFDGGSY